MFAGLRYKRAQFVIVGCLLGSRLTLVEMLSNVEQSKKHGHLRGSQRSHDMPPPFLDPSDPQYGTQVGQLTSDDVRLLEAPEPARGTAADLRARNQKRFSLATPEGWALATPSNSMQGSSPDQATRKPMGVTETLLRRMFQ